MGRRRPAGCFILVQHRGYQKRLTTKTALRLRGKTSSFVKPPPLTVPEIRKQACSLDGIYVADGKRQVVFRQVPPPSDAEVARVAERIHRRVANLMERRGFAPLRLSGP